MEKSVLDLLLQMEIPQPQTKEVKIKRLSKLCGENVVFKLRQLSYSKVAEIKRLSENSEPDIMTVLAGVVEPSFKEADILAKYKAATPVDVVKKLLLPGEVADLAKEIEKLAGYRTDTIEAIDEIKKK